MLSAAKYTEERMTVEQLFSLKGRSALVTGAAMGLGRGMAAGLAAAGARVVVADRDGKGAADTVDAIREAGGEAVPHTVDMADPAAIDALFAFIESDSGRLDILVNNAGRSTKDAPESVSLTEWELTYRINATAYLLTAQRAFPFMRKAGGGSIINVSSIAGSAGQGRGSLAYSVSKAAVNQLTRELAVEWGVYGIRVNAILPCQIMTPGLEAYLATPAGANILERWLDGLPLDRLGEISDLVGPVVFLASPASAMVTGHLLAVDGGNLATNAAATVRKVP
jgi:NAD(P)-dependent dehydrogenase (short-subunit alcohol dehydrogenase family)